MGGIFISYRRHDSAGWTGHLSDYLEQCFGPDQIFKDIEKIEAGTGFMEAIERAVGSCSILLAIIGPEWMASPDKEGQTRLDNSEDYTRLEIATALSRNILVIPVLVGGAVMPTTSELPDDLKLLTRRQAHKLTDSRWYYDTEQLVRFIEKAGINRKQELKPDIATLVEPPAKMSAKAIASNFISAIILLMLFKGDNLTFDMKIGSLVMSLAALTLGGVALFETMLHKAKGKILATIGVALSGLTLLINISKQTPHDTTPKRLTKESAPFSQSLPTPSQQGISEPVSLPQDVADFNGIWGGSDGLTYNIRQNGNRVTISGGYPNQEAIITGSGIINGHNIELDYIRITDRTGGKARLRVSANRTSLKGHYQNLVTGEKGVMAMNR